MNTNEIQIRTSLLSDYEGIESLMKRSMHHLGKGYYTDKQIESCCKFVCVPDRQLIEDKTFYVAVIGETIVGCGGWSYRNTLYAGPKEKDQQSGALDPEKDAARIRAMFTDPNFSGKGIGSKILAASEKAAKDSGFKRATLGATQSGLAFYEIKGWKRVIEEFATLPDGVVISVIRMDKDL